MKPGTAKVINLLFAVYTHRRKLGIQFVIGRAGDLTIGNVMRESNWSVKTCLSCVDGERGKLLIAGYPIEDFATGMSYDEAVRLLWEGIVPGGDAIGSLGRGFSAAPFALGEVTTLLRLCAMQNAAPIDALRTAVSLLGAHAKISGSSREDALTVVAGMPAIVAAYARLRDALEPVASRPDFGHSANFLYMLTGTEPGAAQARALETYMITVIDHGVSASTLVARVTASTGSDLFSAVAGAIGALKGPLHGGAPGPVRDMLREIGEPANAEPYLRAKLVRGERLMGFGHRDYRVRDPRAGVLEAAAERLYATLDGEKRGLYTLARHVERTALDLLEEHKPGRRLNTNLEFWVALLLHGVGLSPDLFTPAFAMARSAGWCAHYFEQAQTGRMIQPQTAYVGPDHRPLTATSL